jgi:Tn3 transposase DDE domain
MIVSQKNLHESRHALARKIRHGDHGLLRERYREGMEDQLGALGLMLNCVVLWNTIYMDKARAQRQAAGRPIPEEILARLSPLIHEHLKFSGRYPFTVPSSTGRYVTPTRPRTKTPERGAGRTRRCLEIED